MIPITLGLLKKSLQSYFQLDTALRSLKPLKTGAPGLHSRKSSIGCWPSTAFLIALHDLLKASISISRSFL